MSSFTFGMYPGSAVGAENGLAVGKPDIPEKILVTLQELQPTTKPFLVRGYLGYVGNGQIEAATPENVAQYASDGRKLDLVLCYRAADEPLHVWTEFIVHIIGQYGSQLAMLQITEEPNSTGPGGDGIMPNIRAALIAGVITAKSEVERLGLSVKIGFSATINFNPLDDFWTEIGRLGGQSFSNALDYVALDFFADVFMPILPTVSLADAVKAVLHQFRNVHLTQAGIPATVPIYIGENGWPTAPNRSYERQAEVLETIIRTVHAHRETFAVRGYTYFNLRDTDSANATIFYQFGLLRDDYTPKPAYAVFRKLVAELSE